MAPCFLSSWGTICSKRAATLGYAQDWGQGFSVQDSSSQSLQAEKEGKDSPVPKCPHLPEMTF